MWRVSGIQYQQPVKYNLATARKVLKHVYTAERLQLPTSLGAVFGTYGILWGRAGSLGYWREFLRSGEYACLGVYALEEYGIFKVRFVLSSLFLRARLMVLWHVAGWRDCGAQVRRLSHGVELGACATIPQAVLLSS